MQRFAWIAFVALAACRESVDDTVEKTRERADELRDRAAERAGDVAEKTAEDVKAVARGSADEAKRVADEAARAAERAGTHVADETERAADAARSRVAERVDAAGEHIDRAAEIAKDGMPEPAAPHEVREAMHDLDTAVSCDGAGTCTVTRAFADRLRERPDVLAAQARLERAASGTGVQMRNLGELPRRLGFQHDDVVTAINDVQLTGRDAMPELMLQLGSSRFEIDYLRGGEALTLVIDVV
jgi:hypothetical protein